MTGEAAAPVLYDADGPIAHITLNRPSKRNALNQAVIGGLHAALERGEGDPAVRVVAIRGAGDDFCAGADLGELRTMLDASVVDNIDDAERLASLFARMRGAGKPIVALVRGRALGGGCGLATACDLVLASETARFGYTEVRLGFVPALVLALLSRSVSEKRAFEMISSGELYDAKTVASFGLVNRVFSEDDFEAEADRYLLALADRDATAVRLGKRLLYRQGDMSFEAALGLGVELNALARKSDGLKEGISRFFDRGRGGEGRGAE